jgi:hypothetical protein
LSAAGKADENMQRTRQPQENVLIRCLRLSVGSIGFFIGVS